MLPLDDLIRQIILPGLPVQLVSNYLFVLREAYLETARANKEVRYLSPIIPLSITHYLENKSRCCVPRTMGFQYT